MRTADDTAVRSKKASSRVATTCLTAGGHANVSVESTPSVCTWAITIETVPIQRRTSRGYL